MSDFWTTIRLRALRVLFALGIVIAVLSADDLTSGFDWGPFVAGFMIWLGAAGWSYE